MQRVPLRLILCSLLIAGGCSGASTSGDFDSQAARETLVETLDAWKEGRVAELSQADRPIHFVDDDQRQGARLVSYEIPSTRDSIRPFHDAAVSLALEGRNGKMRQKQVAYQVSLTPGRTVLRSAP
jgi:hypothetical protein